jgi:tetratricopeptide (TPR) repeat protein
MAASRVNTKFVVILVGALVTVAMGGGGVAYFYVTNNAGRLEELGTKAYEAGDYSKAEKLLSKAVNKEQTNPEYIRKWIAAMEKVTPESENTFRTKYADYYAANVALARRALKTDIAAHRNALEMAHREIKDRTGDTTGNLEMVRSVDEALGFFDPAKPGPHDVLRKYSGMAMLRSYEASANLTEEEINRARTDLEAAVAADPSDGEAVTGLARWYDRRAYNLANKQDITAATEARQKARQILADFVSTHPDDVYGQLWDMMVFVTEQESMIRELATEEARNAAAREAAAGASQRLDKLEAALNKVDPAKVDIAMVGRLAALEMRFSSTGPTRASALYEKLAIARPDDSRVLISQAGLMGERFKEAEALVILKKLVELPQKPVSFEGIVQFSDRLRANYLRALYSIRLWEREKEPAAKKTLIEQAREFRGKLAESVPVDSPEVLFIDAHLDISKEDYGQASKKLAEYNRKMNSSDPQGLWMFAECALRLSNDGVAESALRQLIAREPLNGRGSMRLAEVLIRQRRAQEAIPLLERAQQLLPGSATEIASLAEKARAMVTGDTTKLDAVSKLLLDCDALENQGKVDEAFAMLTKGYEESKDIRLAPALAYRMDQRGKRAEALAIVEAGLAKDASDPRLKQMKVMMTVSDPIEQRLIMIDQTQAPAIEKLIAKIQVLRSNNLRERADQFLKEALAIDPNNAAAIEIQFMSALDDKDFAAAGRFEAEASRRDIDLIQGATFKARLLDAQGKLADAVRVLEAEQTKPTFGPPAARMLAQMYVRQRRIPEAIEMLRGAIAKKPADRDSLLALAMLLVRSDQGREALNELRSKQQIHVSDAEIQDLWLQLEARYGEKELALSNRRKQLELRPNDRPTQMAIAQLLVDMRQFPGAMDMINQVKKTGGKDEVVGLEAQWYADQGNLSGAKKVFDDYIASVEPSKLTPEMFLGKGRFMERLNQINDAEAAYKEAAKYQSAKTLDADRALADLYMNQNGVAEARALYQKIVDSGADTVEKLYARKLVDTQLRLADGAGALKTLAAMGEVVTNDPQLMLQQAEGVRLTGDEKKSAELVEAAVAKFPNEPFVYYRRAVMNLKFTELRDEVRRDFLKSIEIRPTFWQARRDLARMYNQDGDFQSALNQMREAVKFNPMIDELRVTLVRDLLAQQRDMDAANVIEAVIERRPDDVGLLLNSGDLFREAGLSERALDYYKRAFEISKQLAVVTRYLDLLHAKTPEPDLIEADRVLAAVKDMQDTEPPLLMARAKQLIMRKKVKEGISDIVSSIRRIRPDQPGMIMAWFGDIKRMLKDPKDVTLILDTVDKEKLIPGWTSYFKAGTLMEKEETRAEATAMFEKMMVEIKDPVLLRQVALALQARYYQANDCENGLRVMRQSVEWFPNDAYVLNNLAYMMVRCGDDPAKAVPIAERAIQAMLNVGRSSADIYDTMGMVYVRAGMLDKAMLPLQAALAEVGNSPVRATVLMHIAEYHVARGNRKLAEECLAEAEKIMIAAPNASAGAGHAELFKLVKDKLDKMPK